MSVIIVGGNDRMATRYKDICKSYDCKAKVFIKYPTGFDKKIGSPDLAVVFTDTVSKLKSFEHYQKLNKTA